MQAVLAVGLSSQLWTNLSTGFLLPSLFSFVDSRLINPGCVPVASLCHFRDRLWRRPLLNPQILLLLLLQQLPSACIPSLTPLFIRQP